MLLWALTESNAMPWDQVLSLVEFAYDEVPSKAMGMFPFNRVHRIKPLSPLDLSQAIEIKHNVVASKRVQ